MPTKLSRPAIEKSSYAIEISFVDFVGDPVTPDVASWTLTDRHGQVINSRQSVPIVPAETVVILLTGDDLATVPGRSNVRKLAVYFEFDSTLGDDLPMYDEAEFEIIDLVGVT